MDHYPYWRSPLTIMVWVGNYNLTPVGRVPLVINNDLNSPVIRFFTHTDDASIGPNFLLGRVFAEFDARHSCLVSSNEPSLGQRHSLGGKYFG